MSVRQKKAVLDKMSMGLLRHIDVWKREKHVSNGTEVADETIRNTTRSASLIFLVMSHETRSRLSHSFETQYQYAAK